MPISTRIGWPRGRFTSGSFPPTEKGAGAEAGAEAGNVWPTAQAGASRTIPADAINTDAQNLDIFDSTIHEARPAQKGAVWVLSAEIGRG
jgi:hypothetical protein